MSASSTVRVDAQIMGPPMVQEENPQSVQDVLLAYEQAVRQSLSPSKADATMAQLRTALLRYTLPGWGFPRPQGQRLKAEEVEAGLNCLAQVGLERLPFALELQEQLFEELQVPSNSRRNYRLALNKMLAWCQQQCWYPSAAEAISLSDHQPLQRSGSAQAVRLTRRKKLEEYALGAREADVIPADVQHEIDAFYQFLTTPAEHSAPNNKVSESTARQYKHHLLLVMGWLHRVQGAPLEQVRLTAVVEFVPIRSQSQGDVVAISAAERTLRQAKAYISWLQAEQAEGSALKARGSRSLHTESKIFATLIAVAKYLYRQETNYPIVENYDDIPVITSLRAEIRRVNRKISAHQRISDPSKTRITKAEFEDLVEALREECSPQWWLKTSRARRQDDLKDERARQVIAQHYQPFLLAALMLYLPPQRQRVYRQLQFFQDSKLLKQALDSQRGGYLYRKGDEWWIQVFPDLYKQGQQNTQSWQQQVPNPHYSDQRCFYQYLEEWLLSYTLQEGETVHTFLGLRSTFSPTHTFVFTHQGGKPFTHAAPFTALLRNPAYRLTGKVVSLDAVRLMLLEQMLSTADEDL